jgi:uncharacterized membrane protein
MSWYSNTALLHAATGTLALLTFWVAGICKKGSPVHKMAGKVYLLAMAGILVSALPLALFIISNESQVAGAFLLYLLVITLTSVWNSWRAIRDKRDWQRYTGRIYKCLMVLNLLSGLVIAYLGIFVADFMQLVISSFSLIGIVSAIRMYRFQQTAPSDPRWWMKEHINAMLGNGIATHIAFLQIGFPKLFPMLAGPLLANLAWLGPLVFAGIAGFYLNKKYVPKRT